MDAYNSTNRVLRPLSVFIAPNSLWLKTFTAQSGYCLLHRMPFLILCACAHSLIPRPKTTVTGLGMRLVHTENSAPTMAGRVYSCGSGKALWTSHRVLVNRCRNRALYIYLHTFIFIYHPWGHNRKISCFPSWKWLKISGGRHGHNCINTPKCCCWCNDTAKFLVCFSKASVGTQCTQWQKGYIHIKF